MNDEIANLDDIGPGLHVGILSRVWWVFEVRICDQGFSQAKGTFWLTCQLSVSNRVELAASGPPHAPHPIM